MSHEATIKLAPVFTAERYNDPKWNRPGRFLYRTGALEFLPGKTSVPLIVDHDESREIGTVHRFWKLDWTDGPWLCAEATVNTAPSWLGRGTRASFELQPFNRCEYNIRGTQAEEIVKAFVSEVSVLSPSTKPAEPLAQVLSYRSAEAPKRTPSDRAVAGEVIYGDGRTITRHFANAVLAVGGVPVLRTRSGQAIRREGRDYVIDNEDGSSTIYSAEGYAVAQREGTVGVR